MTKITLEEVQQTAALSGLQLVIEELPIYQDKLISIFNLLGKMQAVNLDEVVSLSAPQNCTDFWPQGATRLSSEQIDIFYNLPTTTIKEEK
jgi:Asp-tRNA(Asn)/Glu-tRNA(Gln) amidotransferase C subunit